jgi:hypothetical protein
MVRVMARYTDAGRRIAEGLPRMWRKDGPCGWWRVVGTQFPTDAWYDGGIAGVSVEVSEADKYIDGKGWTQRWSYPMFVCAKSAEHFEAVARDGYRYPEGESKRETGRGEGA